MSQLTLNLNLQPARKAWTVSELTAKIRDLLAKNFTDITVQGEISNCREAQSGHIYFTLKDDRAQVRCVFFKQQQRGIKFRPEDGLQMTVRGSISVYETRGEYQIYVENLEPIGLGALQLAFEQLKKRLEAEGLFAAERKNRPWHVIVAVDQSGSMLDSAIFSAVMASIFAELPSRNRLFAELLRRLAVDLRLFEARGFTPLIADWEKRHCFQRKPVRLTFPDGSAVSGVAEGVAADGSLALSTSAGRRRLCWSFLFGRFEPHSDGGLNPSCFHQRQFGGFYDHR